MIEFKSKTLILALLASSALTAPALAQEAEFVPKPRETVDQNGVDLAIGKVRASTPAISIGAGAQGLTFSRSLDVSASATRWTHPYIWALYGTVGSTVQVMFGGATRSFAYNSTTSTYVNQQSTGETLTVSGPTWTFTTRGGTVAAMDGSDFDTSYSNRRYGALSTIAVAHTVTSPDGHRLTLTYAQTPTANPFPGTSNLRLQSAQSSYGYMAKFEYQASSGSFTYQTWQRLTKATLINSSVDYCDPAANTCTFSTAWPSLSFSPTISPITVTDALGRATIFSFSGGQLSAYRRPTSSTDNETITFDANGRVQTLAIDGRTWTYAWSLSAPLMTATVTNPDSTQRVYVTDTTLNVLKSYRDELNRTITYTYDTSGRLTDLTYPEGNKRHYVFDARGNVTEARAIAKTGSGLSDIVKTASYPSTCTNAVTCNRPTNVTDPKGNVTDLTYDSTHGGVLTVTAPAPTTGATRPQARYGYTALQAYYKNSSGSIVASGQPTYLLTSTSACQTAASCSGVADEVKSTITYGPQSAGTANNLLPVSVSKGAGDGSLTATTAMTYDIVGNLTYVDGPLSGTTDTSRTLYDADREVIGQIGPDPDGAGALPNRAARLTYNADGQVTKTENGTTAGQSDTAWSAFTAADFVDTAYDASGRATTQTLKNGTIAYALTQFSYDTLGRSDCSAVRMNPAVYGSLPSSACTLGTAGSFGNDRISQIVYDAASEPTQLKVAVGTSDAATERTLTYSSNGLVQTLTDGENNKTTYVYDGFDRLSQTQYPSATKGAGTSNSSDYEQLSYDANSNVTSFRNRASNVFNFSFDNLNRMTFKDRPGTDADVTYGYDNIGRLTSASQINTSLTFTYDALSRQTSEGGQAATVYQQFDLAGQRTQLSTSNGYLINFQRLVTGEMKAMVNGSSYPYATLTYDDLGRRTGVSYFDGSSASSSYDPVSRLASLAHDFSGTANDVTKTFSYNPASQIVSETRSSDAYAYTAMGNGSLSTTTNGLNQPTNIGGGIPTHDANGNLTYDPVTGKSYVYTSENQLTGSNGIGLYYDPLDRLMLITPSSGTRKFLYAPGDSGAPEAIEELDGSNALVASNFFGPGPDEPLASWDGAASTLRPLHTDERGSIIAVGDGAGGVTAINAFDEYGRPGASNLGRFQYTGQMWLPEASAYNYKARTYSPALERFLQTDPVGTDGGINLYAYTGNDPVNLTDPLGLQEGDIYVTADVLTTLAAGLSGVPALWSRAPQARPSEDMSEIRVTGTRDKPPPPLKQVCEGAKSARAAFEKGVNLGPAFIVAGAVGGGAVGSAAGPPGAVAGAGAGAAAGAAVTELAGIGSSTSQFVVDLTTAKSASDVAQAFFRLGIGVAGGKVVEGLGRSALKSSYLSTGAQKLVKSVGGAAADKVLGSVDSWLNPTTPC